METSVYKLRASIEDWRPEIDFQHPSFANIDWDDLLQGHTPRQQAPDFVATGNDATAWDFFGNPGTLGVMSDRAVRLLRDSSRHHLRFAPVRVGGAPYHLLIRGVPFDCLDLEHSDLELFSCAPHRVMRITRFAFKPDLLPDQLLFCIPESLGSVLATGGVRDVAVQAGLRGLNFERVWSS